MSKFKNFLFGMGNPLLDISTDVGEAFLKKYDLKLGSAIMAEKKHLPIYSELSSKYKCEYTAGGATQNVFRAFQWMLNEGPGCATYTGCIGDDEFGKTLEKLIRGDGVNGKYMTDKTVPTGTCASLIFENERTLVANLSACEKFTKEYYGSEEIQNLMKGAKMYYFSGFFITVAADSMLDICMHAKKENKNFAINLSAEFVVNFFHDPLQKLLNDATFVFGNETECRCYAKKMNWDEQEDVAKIAVKTAEFLPFDPKRPKTVVFTQGKDPVCVAVQKSKGSATLTKHEIVPTKKVVDTNGAGDSFVGGFLSQLAKGEDIKTCVDAGKFCSRVIVETSGIVFPEEPPSFKK